MVLKLYGFIYSTNTQRVVLVLKELNVPYEFVNVDLTKGEQKSAEYLAKQPFGVVPFMVCNSISFVTQIGIDQSLSVLVRTMAVSDCARAVRSVATSAQNTAHLWSRQNSRHTRCSSRQLPSNRVTSTSLLQPFFAKKYWQSMSLQPSVDIDSVFDYTYVQTLWEGNR